MRTRLLATTLFTLIATQAFSSCLEDDIFHRGCLPTAVGDIATTWQKSVDSARELGSQIKPMDIIKVKFQLAEPIIQAVGASNVPYLNSAAQNVVALGTKLDKETQTAISNALTNPAKGIRDAAQTAMKAANDTIDAAKAAERYGERTISGSANILTDAESRIREGKVVDAVWHLGTDRLRLQNDNAAKLMQESEVARKIAEKAALTYGGPAGAAAFAAWYTYNNSKGDVGQALMAGTYAYIVFSGNAEAGKMPTGTVSEVVKKAATVAAVRGLAVGAAGGTQQEMLDTMAQSGGEVIVQSGQGYVTKNVLPPLKAKADAFCLNQVNETCEDPMQWVDDTKKQAEEYQNIASGVPTVLVTGDGEWAVSWNKKALVNPEGKAPGVVLTYIGQGSPYRKVMMDFRKISTGDIPPEYRDQSKPPVKPEQPKKPVVPVVIPPAPKTYSVTFASNGLWIDDRRFPMGRSSLNKIEFSIDGEYQSTMYLYEGMESFTADLTAGTHVFAYSVRVRSSEGGKIQQDCAKTFTVAGVELYSPHITFDRVDPLRGTISECSIRRQ